MNMSRGGENYFNLSLIILDLSTINGDKLFIIFRYLSFFLLKGFKNDYD